MDVRALAEVRLEPAGTAQPDQVAGARPRYHEPLAVHHVARDRTGVLEHERARPAGHGTGDPLDAHEARRPVRTGHLKELGHTVTLDVAAEALLDVDPREDRTGGRLLVCRRLVLVDGDDPGRS